MADGGIGQERGVVLTRQARDRDELEAALRLVHDNYVLCDYTQPQPSGIRIGPHYAVPSTRTFVAVLNGDEVVATVSLFLDSPLKLPLDSVFADKADELRAAGRRPAEVGMLADRRTDVGRTLDLLLQMMKHVFRRARSAGADDLLITVRPRHARFYEKLLCFEPFAPARPYAAVANVPAELLRLRLRPDEIAAVDARAWIKELFLSPADPPHGQTEYSIHQEDLEHFFIHKSEVFARLPAEQRQAVEGFYPGLNLAEMLASAAVAERRP